LFGKIKHLPRVARVRLSRAFDLAREDDLGLALGRPEIAGPFLE
jgi:hypothetical protein